MAAQVAVFALGLSLAIHRHAPIVGFLNNGVAGQQVPPSPLTVLALWPPMLARGEWWRLLTYALVHFGALHILMNLYGHFTLGPIVERMYGSARFLILYLLSALGGGVAAALLSAPEAHTAGSSGALCGLIGGFAAFVLLNRRHLGGELFDASRRWLGNTIVLLVLFSLMPRVSWQGHLGGFVAGMVAGVLLVYHRFGTAEQRWAALLGLVLLPLAGIAPLVERHVLQFPRSAPDDRTAFQEQVVPVVERLRARTAAVTDDVVDPLRYRPGKDRDPAAVKQARSELAALGREEQLAQLQIAHAGPYRAAVLQEAQRAALDYVSDRMQVTQAFDTCFARGPEWTIASDKAELDETRLQGLLNRALEAELRWRRLSRAAQAAP
jgi:membrane associated rhomboid family serine protease